MKRLFLSFVAVLAISQAAAAVRSVVIDGVKYVPEKAEHPKVKPLGVDVHHPVDMQHHDEPLPPPLKAPHSTLKKQDKLITPPVQTLEIEKPKAAEPAPAPLPPPAPPPAPKKPLTMFVTPPGYAQLPPATSPVMNPMLTFYGIFDDGTYTTHPVQMFEQGYKIKRGRKTETLPCAIMDTWTGACTKPIPLG